MRKRGLPKPRSIDFLEESDVRQIAIMTETSSGMTPAIQQQMDILTLPHSIHVGGATFHESPDIPPGHLFEMLKSDPRQVSTSAVTPGTFLQAFSNAIAGGRQVLLICLPSRFSCTIQNAHVAREMCSRPDQVFIYDGRAFGFTLTKLAIAAAQLADRGLPVTQIMPQLDVLRQRARASVWLADMSAVARGGRAMDVMKDFLGSVLDIHPVLTFAGDGSPRLLQLTRTLGQGIRAMVDFVQSREIQPGEVVCVAHGRNPEGARLLLEEVNRRLPQVVPLTLEMSGLLYIHLGDGAVSLSI